MENSHYGRPQVDRTSPSVTKTSWAPERKVKYGSATTAGVFIVTFLLTHYVLHRALTSAEQNLLPGIVAAVIGWAVAYWVKHEKQILADL